MKPVAIFRHVAIEGPGYFSEFLDERKIPWELVAIDSGDPVPRSASKYSALVFMGGPMSVNDNLAWMSQAVTLIRNAFDENISLLGHCLGGQLISKALGGVVVPNPVKEIGWGEVSVSDNDVAREWLGGISSFSAFHWHGETFSIPQGATRILSGEYCANQAWALGKHLALQCHVEMTAEMISSWYEIGSGEVVASIASPAVQQEFEVKQQIADKLPKLQNIAAQLYSRWISGI